MIAEPYVLLDPPTFERAAGSTLDGRVMLPESSPASRVEVELVLAWHTDDKGHHEHGVGAREVVHDGRSQPPSEMAFQMKVPWSPWSHQGTLVKIRWKLELKVTTDGFARSWDMPFAVLPPSDGGDAQPYRGMFTRETAR